MAWSLFPSRKRCSRHVAGRIFERIGATARRERRARAVRLQQRVEHLDEPALLAVEQVVGQADAGRVEAGDLGRAEENVPEEQQVAEVALVVADAVGGGE